MKFLFTILSVLFLSLAYLLPYHASPWPTFGSEILTLLAGSFLVLSVYQQKIKIPKPQWIALPLLLIPLLQWMFGQIIYFSNAMASFEYIVLFWLLVITGYNFSNTPDSREKIFEKFCFLFLGIGLISSLIAIFQWLNLSAYFSPGMYALKGNRPYANLAQPNNLATLLTVSLMACLYFYEKKLTRNLYLVPISLLLVFSVALTQSRTSWVVCLFIVFYWTIKQFNQRKCLSFPKLMLWMSIFVISIASLPLINTLISSFSGQDIAQTASVVERATSGYLRLDMWSQMLIALQQHPWVGYGWNQTGIAQIAAFDLYPSHEWYKSAHNILFDLLVWNGIPLGALIICYLSAWLFWLNKGVKDTISIVATLMVCAILIHGMLEYPLHYAYFLLPVGFLLGIIQAQYPKLPSIYINSKVLMAIAVVSIVCLLITVKDYFLYKDQSVIASQTTPLTADQKSIMDQKIILLSQFEERIWWIQLNPKTQMNPTELEHVGRVVANLASKYDLYKYAQVLAFNGQKAEAEHQLWILEQLHGQKRSYAELLK